MTRLTYGISSSPFVRACQRLIEWQQAWSIVLGRLHKPYTTGTNSTSPPPPRPFPMPPYTILITSFIYNHVGQERGSGFRKCGIIEQTSECYSTILDPLVLARFCKVFQGLLSTMVFFPVSPHSHGYQLHVHVLVVSCKQFKMHRLEKLLPT